ncbi:MAG: efflux RND transporter periplasmic adaptor subunit [Melioribacteraceae bacterium]|nr:efflux RND transporter periplasmic adaptor subunit [Melioribacteraceae bacterium]MCF8264369.1 efflux RND transporter periplasmic adaptor subunit [Melioribacteraceae bacterium]MCF8414028.1 efflux RND transporter periplasmic adaptor subunit [Melioribacteraceae bacterium]
MKKYLKQIALFSLFALMAISQISCDDAEANNEESAEDKELRRAVRVETKELAAQSFTDNIQIVGAVKPMKNSDISYFDNGLGGIIKEFKVDKGSRVKKGDILFTIDNTSVKAAYDAAKAQYDLAQMSFEKQEQVYNQNVNSEFQYLEAKFRRDQAKANFESMKDRLDKTYVTAPFNGIVDAKFYDIGELAPPGMPVMTLIDIDKVKIEAGLPERYVGKIKKGDQTDVIIRSLGDQVYTGLITFVGSSVSVANRTFPIEVTVNNSGGEIKPELVAEVYIANGVYDKIIMIPEDVVSRNDDGYVVYVEKDGRSVGKSIEIINRIGNRIAVKSGLEAGENLIVVGYQNLIEGERVKVVN